VADRGNLFVDAAFLGFKALNRGVQYRVSEFLSGHNLSMTRFAGWSPVGGATFEPFAGRHSALVRGSVHNARFLLRDRGAASQMIFVPHRNS
jgi:hypothetical protein